MKVIRDSIHGNIELTPLEIAIIDTPELQRLRYVRQLSLAYLVYPSALHTRFEHSLGTMHLTKLLSERLFRDKEEKQLLRLAALLHDVGHSAFSHLPEELIRKVTGKSHEKMGEEKILSGNIAQILEKHQISPKKLAKFMKGSKAKIISSELGTDRMDYLLRDAYFTGVAYSVVDAQRLLLSLTYENGRLALEEKGILAAESLLVSRYLMFNAVYNHHAVRIAAAMLNKGLEIAL
ncbi:MAG: HD domain-containing protein, partial [Candidatus Micrarchaeota archaeon]